MKLLVGFAVLMMGTMALASESMILCGKKVTVAKNDAKLVKMVRAMDEKVYAGEGQDCSKFQFQVIESCNEYPYFDIRINRLSGASYIRQISIHPQENRPPLRFETKIKVRSKLLSRNKTIKTRAQWGVGSAMFMKEVHNWEVNGKGLPVTYSMTLDEAMFGWWWFAKRSVDSQCKLSLEE